MQQVKKERFFQYGERILFAGFFLIAFLLCGLISYTDGDDAYFSSMAHSMPFLEYLKMRYISWEGRMTSEAMTYIAFYFGKGFWQLVNALVLTLLPTGLIGILKRMAGEMPPDRSFFLSAVMYLGILSLGTETIGYGAFWITGSTFYLWSITAGIWGILPFVDLVYRKKAASPKAFLYALPCGLIAAMGQEQIAAVVIVFGALAVICDFYREHKIAWLHLCQVLLMTAALVILFLSPGTGARSQSEIATWMPQYDTMSLGNHVFITLQWILSSFANEGKMLFVLIWGMAGTLLWKQHGRKSRILAVLSGIAAAAALLPYVGITWFSQMGMGVEDITTCVTQVATPASLTAQNWFAMIWWLLAVVLTLAILWQTEEELTDRCTMCLCVLAAVASEAIMFFSPTMYASGARVYFVAQILLWLVMGRLCEKVLHREHTVWPVVFAAAAGAVNAVSGLAVVMMYL